MAASAAAASMGGGSGPATNAKDLIRKIKAKKEAEMGGSGEAVPVTGNASAEGGDAGTKLDQIKSIVGGGGGGGAEQQAVGPAAQPKKKGGIWGGIGKALGGFSGLFYKMPAAGKYNNSPIEKNYGSPAQRGFHAPNKMKSFGVGESNKEKMGGVGSNLLDK